MENGKEQIDGQEQTENKPQHPKGAVYKLQVGDYSCYLKEISRPVMEIALGMIMPINGAPRLITAGEIILNSCWIEGDQEIRTVEKWLIEASLKCCEMIERQNSELAKL